MAAQKAVAKTFSMRGTGNFEIGFGSAATLAACLGCPESRGMIQGIFQCVFCRFRCA